MAFRAVPISPEQITAGPLPPGVTVPVGQVTSGQIAGLFTVGAAGGPRAEIGTNAGGESGIRLYSDATTETVTMDAATGNVTIRGTFAGTDYVINAAGVFLYSGTPAAGNLIVSIARTSGTDPYGNAYSAGVVSYALGYSAQLFSAQFSVHHSGMTVDGQLYANESGSASVGPSMVLRSPSDAAGGAHISTVLAYGQSSNGTWPAQVHIVGWTDATLTTEEPIEVRVNGQLYATDPVTPSNGQEVWHTVTYASGWSTPGSPIEAAAYRLTPTNNVELKGGAFNGSAAAGQTIFTLPAPYRPPVVRTLTCWGRTSLAPAGITVNTDGTVVLTALPSGCHTFEFDGVFYSLDL